MRRNGSRRGGNTYLGDNRGNGPGVNIVWCAAISTYVSYEAEIGRDNYDR